MVNTATNINKDVYYIRDASGNTMGVYEQEVDTMTWKEQYLYGSSRLGGIKPLVEWTTTLPETPTYTDSLSLGWKYYEAGNHLGNVLSVSSDRKIKVDSDGDNEANYFEATILSATDYYPFGDRAKARHPKCLDGEVRRSTNPAAERGVDAKSRHSLECSCGMDMPSRTYASADYRYAFNGKEKDNSEEWGDGNHYDYGFRIYNPEIAKFLSVDPLTSTYPFYSPYHYAGNSPIANVDLDGLEPIAKQYYDEDGTPTLDIQEDWMTITASKLPVGYTRVMNSLGKNSPLARGIGSRVESGDSDFLIWGSLNLYRYPGPSKWMRKTSNSAAGLLATGFAFTGGSAMFSAGLINRGTAVAGAWEVGGSLVFNGNTSGVDYFDIFLGGTGLGFVGDITLGSTIDINKNGVESVFSGVGEQKDLATFRNDVLASTLGEAASAGLKQWLKNSSLSARESSLIDQLKTLRNEAVGIELNHFYKNMNGHAMKAEYAKRLQSIMGQGAETTAELTKLRMANSTYSQGAGLVGSSVDQYLGNKLNNE